MLVRNKLLGIFLMFLLLGMMPAFAVIQDRGIQTSITTSMNDDILSSIANLDKTLSALNSKLPTLIEARFNYYESIQRQNQVKQVIAELGAFIIALMVYALIRNKNDRDKERVLTRSEQILTNIEKRIHKLESADEVNVNVVETKSSIEKPIESRQLSLSKLYEKYQLSTDIDPTEIYCPICTDKMAKGSFKSACSSCLSLITSLLELQNKEKLLIKKQLKLGFCSKCEPAVKRGGLQRDFILCDECMKLLAPKPKDKVVKSIEKKEKDVVETIHKVNFPDGVTDEEKRATKPIIFSDVKQQKLKTIKKSKKSVVKNKNNKDKFLGIDML
ncbi:hypothetical protein GQ473_03775 [archaeon]|nr:hypothetical protein [archaeon]